MKYLLSLLFIGLLSGCANDTTEEKPSSTMILSKESIALTQTTPIDSATVRLSCGCGFNLIVESYTGDTTVIRYETRAVDDLTAKTMAMVFRPIENAAVGSYSAKLAFLNTGEKGSFRDTISVTYTK